MAHALAIWLTALAPTARRVTRLESCRANEMDEASCLTSVELPTRRTISSLDRSSTL